MWSQNPGPASSSSPSAVNRSRPARTWTMAALEAWCSVSSSPASRPNTVTFTRPSRWMTFDTIAPGWMETAPVASATVMWGIGRSFAVKKAEDGYWEGVWRAPPPIVGEVWGQRGQVAGRHLERPVPEREADPALQDPKDDRPCSLVFGHVPTLWQGDQHDAEAGSIHDRGRRVVVPLVGGGAAQGRELGVDVGGV